MSGRVTGFDAGNQVLKTRLFKQGCLNHKRRKPFSNSIDVTMTLYQNSIQDSNLFLNWQGLSEPEFYGDLVYKFKTINVGRNDFSDQFRKIIIRYKIIGYNMNVMRQTLSSHG